MNDVSLRKKLLYIGHSYHNKTQSTIFLKELLSTAYEVEIFDFDPYNDNIDTHFDCLYGREFDMLIIFQIMPNIKMLKNKVRFTKAAFFPMFDGSPGVEDPVWLDYQDMNIINFSKTLHDRLIKLGLSSYYVQYFPKPKANFIWGDPKRVYFWQRLTELNINTVDKLLANTAIDKIHIHKALDPGHTSIEHSTTLANKIEYSVWYENKADMIKDMESCSLYIAPRLYEGIGMSFLEAMAMGRCVIAPNHPTMNEYIKHGQTGILYDFNNPEAIELPNVKEMQKNAFEYIQCGYKQWEQEQHMILEWIERVPQINKTLLKQRRKKRNYLKKDKYYLFSCIHFLSVRYREHKVYYDIFDVVRVLKIEHSDKQAIYYLFGFILVWKVTYA